MALSSVDLFGALCKEIEAVIRSPILAFASITLNRLLLTPLIHGDIDQGVVCCGHRGEGCWWMASSFLDLERRRAANRGEQRRGWVIEESSVVILEAVNRGNGRQLLSKGNLGAGCTPGIILSFRYASSISFCFSYVIIFIYIQLDHSNDILLHFLNLQLDNSNMILHSHGVHTTTSY